MRAIIMALLRRSQSRTQVVTLDGEPIFKRFEPLLADEWVYEGELYDPLPWWCPFNALLHLWQNTGGESFHDHPRWSVTIVLAGQITEITPWSRRVLTPGCVVFRSHKAIHRFELDPEYAGRTWTLFLVGRRKHQQHRFEIRDQRSSKLSANYDAETREGAA